jgi:fatty acid desaturase
MELRAASSYVHELRKRLGPELFAPARSRVLWVPVHLALITAAMIAVARGWLPWFLVPLASLVIGVGFAGLTFVAHEALHGGIVRGRRLQHLLGWIGFAPFVVSPRLWRAWHNREHHGHTSHPVRDPDTYPMLSMYQDSRAVRVVTDSFSLGGRRWTGVLSLILGFSVQSMNVLVGAHRSGMMTTGQRRAAIAETAVDVALWLALLWLVGPLAFLAVYVAPMVVANVMVMSYILTNHGLSPLTEINDPLVNSLSVTVPWFYEWITLGFGHHVEHHVFPAMSTRNAPAVRAAIRSCWPERYQAMPLGAALRALHRTARVYRDTTTLIDPRTGAIWPTLAPRPVAS